MMENKVLGAQLYTVREFTRTTEDACRTLKKVADIGYSAVQISGFGKGVDSRAIARTVGELGLTVAATHVSWTQFQTELDAVIELHELWECKHSAIGGLPTEYRDPDGLKRFLDELPPIAEKLSPRGIDFSYHNHSHEFTRYGSKTWLEMLYEKADPRHLKAELDTYWVQHGGGDPAAWIRKYPGRQSLLHLKDMSITPDRQQRFAEVGEGNLNWPAILEAAASSGVRWYLIEQDNCYDRDPFESLAVSYRNLRAMGLS